MANENFNSSSSILKGVINGLKTSNEQLSSINRTVIDISKTTGNVKDKTTVEGSEGNQSEFSANVEKSLASIGKSMHKTEATIVSINNHVSNTNSLLGAVNLNLLKITSVLSAFRADYSLINSGKQLDGTSYINKQLLVKGMNLEYEGMSDNLKETISEIKRVGIFADLMSNAYRRKMGKKLAQEAGTGVAAKFASKLSTKFLGEDMTGLFAPMLGMAGIDLNDNRKMASLGGSAITKVLSKMMPDKFQSRSSKDIDKNVIGSLENWILDSEDSKSPFKKTLAGLIQSKTGLGNVDKVQKESDPNMVMSALAPHADELRQVAEGVIVAYNKKPKKIPDYAIPVWVVNSSDQSNHISANEESNTKEKDLFRERLTDLIEGRATNKKDKKGRSLLEFSKDDPEMRSMGGLMYEQYQQLLGKSKVESYNEIVGMDKNKKRVKNSSDDFVRNEDGTIVQMDPGRARTGDDLDNTETESIDRILKDGIGNVFKLFNKEGRADLKENIKGSKVTGKGIGKTIGNIFGLKGSSDDTQPTDNSDSNDNPSPSPSPSNSNPNNNNNNTSASTIINQPSNSTAEVNSESNNESNNVSDVQKTKIKRDKKHAPSSMDYKMIEIMSMVGDVSAKTAINAALIRDFSNNFVNWSNGGKIKASNITWGDMGKAFETTTAAKSKSGRIVKGFFKLASSGGVGLVTPAGETEENKGPIADFVNGIKDKLKTKIDGFQNKLQEKAETKIVDTVKNSKVGKAAKSTATKVKDFATDKDKRQEMIEKAKQKKEDLFQAMRRKKQLAVDSQVQATQLASANAEAGASAKHGFLQRKKDALNQAWIRAKEKGTAIAKGAKELGHQALMFMKDKAQKVIQWGIEKASAVSGGVMKLMGSATGAAATATAGTGIGIPAAIALAAAGAAAIAGISVLAIKAMKKGKAVAGKKLKTGKADKDAKKAKKKEDKENNKKKGLIGSITDKIKNREVYIDEDGTVKRIHDGSTVMKRGKFGKETDEPLVINKKEPGNFLQLMDRVKSHELILKKNPNKKSILSNILNKKKNENGSKSSVSGISKTGPTEAYFDKDGTLKNIKDNQPVLAQKRGADNKIETGDPFTLQSIVKSVNKKDPIENLSMQLKRKIHNKEIVIKKKPKTESTASSNKKEEGKSSAAQNIKDKFGQMFGKNKDGKDKDIDKAKKFMIMTNPWLFMSPSLQSKFNNFMNSPFGQKLGKNPSEAANAMFGLSNANAAMNSSNLKGSSSSSSSTSKGVTSANIADKSAGYSDDAVIAYGQYKEYMKQQNELKLRTGGTLGTAKISDNTGTEYTTSEIVQLELMNSESKSINTSNTTSSSNSGSAISVSGNKAEYGELAQGKTAKEYFLATLPNSYLSSPYGWRILSGQSDFHKGNDYAGCNGANIYTPVGGLVTQAGYHKDMGNYVYIKDGNGYIHRFMHMAQKPIVQANAEVPAGQVLGIVGTTGASTGPHLHYDVSKGSDYYDPALFTYPKQSVISKTIATAKNIISDASTYIVNAGTEAASNTGDFISNTVDVVEDTVANRNQTSTNGKGTQSKNGMGSHIYQKVYDGINYGSNSLAQAGCAPAVAAQILKNLGKGNSSSVEMLNAADYSLSKNYVEADGGLNWLRYYGNIIGNYSVNCWNDLKFNKLQYQ